jgi:nitrite reductase/ring-hydroxylating ferredoxin subunit
MALTTVAKTGDLKPGEGKIAEVDGRSLAVFNVDGKFHCIENTCCHKGGPLGEGDLDGTTVTCPWHGWRYDVTTGRCLSPSPAASVPAFPVEVEGEDVKADL